MAPQTASPCRKCGKPILVLQHLVFSGDGMPIKFLCPFCQEPQGIEYEQKHKNTTLEHWNKRGCDDDTS